MPGDSWTQPRSLADASSLTPLSELFLSSERLQRAKVEQDNQLLSHGGLLKVEVIMICLSLKLPTQAGARSIDVEIYDECTFSPDALIAHTSVPITESLLTKVHKSSI